MSAGLNAKCRWTYGVLRGLLSIGIWCECCKTCVLLKFGPVVATGEIYQWFLRAAQNSALTDDMPANVASGENTHMDMVLCVCPTRDPQLGTGAFHALARSFIGC